MIEFIFKGMLMRLNCYTKFFCVSTFFKFCQASIVIIWFRGPAGIRVIFSHLDYKPLNYIAISTITLSNQTALVPLFALSSAQNYRVVRNAHSDTAMYEVRPVKALNLATWLLTPWISSKKGGLWGSLTKRPKYIVKTYYLLN